jgi:hypothetical protein
MAYLDVQNHAAMFATGAARVRQAERTAFERAEWQVIMIAQKDGLESLSEPGWFARLFARVFGGTTIRPLADPKLEALRRFAVLAWHYSYALPASAIEGIKTMGYSDDQLELALAKISNSRGRSGRRAF